MIDRQTNAVSSQLALMDETHCRVVLPQGCARQGCTLPGRFWERAMGARAANDILPGLVAPEVQGSARG